jgi:hypothetical protein
MALAFKDLVNHPYSFAMGVGIANGFLAVGRGKKIDMPTALTLATILGLGEMALIMYEPESERQYSLQATGIYSVLGVLTGLLPFVSPSASHESASPLLVASATPNPAAQPNAVSGWNRQRRAAAPRRRARYA